MAHAIWTNTVQERLQSLSDRSEPSELRMAGQPFGQQLGSYLDSNQQDLLLAALNSQAKKPVIKNDDSSFVDETTSDRRSSTTKMSTLSDTKLFMSPLDATVDSFDYTPDLDYLDGEAGFDFENADLGGEMIGSLPGGSSSDSLPGSPDQHEKRKNPDGESLDDGGDAKRQETGQEGEKQAKKPGRKPLTSEPTTKRKAQNRAAQRAFRERKEKHVKDLETKVNDLTKGREADQHENGLLKAQVERLQSELRDYRKRLSLDRHANNRVNRSPSQTGVLPRSNSGPNHSAPFHFDFPKFGIIGQAPSQSPADSNIERENLTPSTMDGSPMTSSRYSQPPSRHHSQSHSVSPGVMPGNSSTPTSLAMSQTMDSKPSKNYSTVGNMHGFANSLPAMNNDLFGDLFSPSILKGVSMDNGGYFNDASTGQELNGGETNAGLSRTFQFNPSGSMSDSASPSTTVSSQWNPQGPSSSCGTSPEPSHGSPTTKDKLVDNNVDKQNSQLRNVTNQDQLANTNSLFAGVDFSVPSANTFDPVLFGDYRDPSSNALFGTNELSGGLFDDALNVPFDLGSPSNLFGILSPPKESIDTLKPTTSINSASTPSASLMAQMDKARDGGDDDDYGLPATQPKKVDDGKLVSCNNIWNQLQSNPDFQDGKFDLDGLCSELRAKARCSESGVMVAEKYVDAAIRKLGQKDVNGAAQKVPNLMFEQDSWDKVLKKLSGNSQAGK